ncbi:MAG: LON peptidase substrate-binding domain-containing protein [Panacagrimonas sp.]
MMIDIPIFPLDTVLFPAGRLPLRIFEVRYVDMTKRCIRDNAVFGVCLVRSGRETGVPALPHALGCTARIVEWNVQGAGLFSLVTEGEQVFRILEQRTGPDGLIQAQVELIEPTPSLPLPESHAVLASFLGEIIEKLGASQFSQPPRLDDAAWVCHRLAEILPMENPSRLELLEPRDPLELLSRIEHLIRTMR